MKCIPERIEDLTRNVVTWSFVPFNKSLAIVMLYPVEITTDQIPCYKVAIVFLLLSTTNDEMNKLSRIYKRTG